MGGDVVLVGMAFGDLPDAVELSFDGAEGFPQGHSGLGDVGDGDGVANGQDADVFAFGKIDEAGAEGGGCGGQVGEMKPGLVHFGLG